MSEWPCRGQQVSESAEGSDGGGGGGGLKRVSTKGQILLFFVDITHSFLS